MKYLNFRSVLSVIQTKHVGAKGVLQMTLLCTLKVVLRGKLFPRLFCYHLLPFRPGTT